MDDVIDTTIRLKKSTKLRLDHHGLFTESYDDILNKILDMIELSKEAA